MKRVLYTMAISFLILAPSNKNEIALA